MSSRLTAKVAYLSDPATYPIIVSIGAAVLMCAGCSGRYLFKSPDVTWSKTDRSSTIRQARTSDINWCVRTPAPALPRPVPSHTLQASAAPIYPASTPLPGRRH